ncbi:hypothetical protein KC660_01340, partial [Candidatus Dojkabacteria bacterium]|nr:hypothetical protein [Candidatus Dojkabacteria bacterium]
MMQEKLSQEKSSNVSMLGAYMSVASAALQNGIVTDSRPVNFTALLDVIQTRRQELRVSSEPNNAMASALRSISGRAYMGGLSAIYAENRLNRGDEHWVTYTQNIIRSELGLSQESKITQDILFSYLDQRLEQERKQAFGPLDPGQIRETTVQKVSLKDKLKDAFMALFETRGRRRLVLASSIALTMTVLSPYMQTAIERINNIVSNKSTNVEASGAILDV